MTQTKAPTLKSDKIAHILPDLATLCDVFQTQLEQTIHGRRNNNDMDEEDGVEYVVITSSFICAQLLSLAKRSDVQEEAGLRRLSSLIHTMLCSSETPEELIEPSVQTLACMQSSEKDFIRCISEALLEVTFLIFLKSVPHVNVAKIFAESSPLLCVRLGALTNRQKRKKLSLVRCVFFQ